MNHLRKISGKFKCAEKCFGLLLLVAIVYMSIICYCDTISGDEYFSVGFANNTKGFLFLTGSNIEKFGSNGWIEGEFLRDYLSVQDGEEFAILDIHRNVRDDVHPPLYFMLLNVLSSFFIDEIPYFAGFLINITCGVIICTILYMLGRKIFNNQWLALAAPIVWLSSEGARVTIIYLRMYAPLCALCLICVYLHVLFFEEEKVSKWLYGALAFCTMIGTLTHYYFYIMLVVVGLVSVIRLLYKRNYRKFAIYSLSHVGGWIISYMAYPYVFKHVLFSERGVGAQATSKTGGMEYYINFARQFAHTINEFVYNNHFSIFFLIFLVICIIAAFVLFYRKKKGIVDLRSVFFAEKNSRTNLVLVGGYALGYLLFLYKISYSSRWLYLSPAFTLIAFFSIGIFAWCLEKIGRDKYISILLIICVMASLSSVITKTGKAFDTYAYRESRHEAITSYSDTCDVLFFYTKWDNLYSNQIQELMEFNQIYSINVNDIETTEYETVLNGRKTQQDVIVYIPTETEDYEKKAKTLAERIGNGIAEMIVEDTFAIYYIDME